MLTDSCLLVMELNCCINSELIKICTGLNSSLYPSSLLEAQAVHSARCQVAMSLQAGRQCKPERPDPDGSWKL